MAEEALRALEAEVEGAAGAPKVLPEGAKVVTDAPEVLPEGAKVVTALVVDPSEEEKRLDDIADEFNSRVTVVESLCMNCREDGTNRFLVMKVPYFRDIVVCSFQCEACGYRSNEVIPAETIAAFGFEHKLSVLTKVDLNRQVIKSNWAKVIIPEIELEVPAVGKGEITTVEGLVSSFADNLAISAEQAEEEFQPRLAEIVSKLRQFLDLEEKFTFIVYDPSGTSHVENPNAPKKDPNMTIETFKRTSEQIKAMGFLPDEEIPKEGDEEVKEFEPSGELESKEDLIKAAKPKSKLPTSDSIAVASAIMGKLDTYFDVTSKAVTLPGTCHSCHMPSEVRMCLIDIPYFKEIILMVSECANCGYRDCEVKPGGGISALGKRVALRVKSAKDLDRDLLKSDSAGICIPELDLELGAGTLGAKFTTIEGLLDDIIVQLTSINAFSLGDSAVDETKAKFKAFITTLEKYRAGSEVFTLIIDDPLGNVFISKESDSDDQVVEEVYERTFEQNEDYGLNDLKLTSEADEEVSEAAATESADK